jgi:hypothetical protein
MNDSKETVAKSKDQAPAIDLNPILTRLEELEERCTQIENTLKGTVTFDKLAARISGKKTIKKRRATREWSEEEKKLSTKKWWQPRKQKKKNDSKLPSLKRRRNKPL